MEISTGTRPVEIFTEKEVNLYIVGECRNCKPAVVRTVEGRGGANTNVPLQYLVERSH